MIPEGMGEDQITDRLSLPEKMNNWNLSQDSSPKQRKRMYEQAKNYKFKLDDINKYSKNLKVRDMNWKFERSAMGKIIPNSDARLKRLQKAAFLNRLEELKKSTDWSQTPVYFMWERNRRWVHQDDTIYSDLECKHLNTSLKTVIDSGMNSEDFQKE